MDDWMNELKCSSQGKWCEECLEERDSEWMWTKVRATWWRQLDRWLQTILQI